ncbi:hypothetical protein B0H19DRAFT_1079012 [Mycena capillaripes]|nr:hypothetical protein B0H19DRAFT_1079012 [Mycena capillaripes]
MDIRRYMWQTTHKCKLLGSGGKCNGECPYVDLNNVRSDALGGTLPLRQLSAPQAKYLPFYRTLEICPGTAGIEALGTRRPGGCDLLTSLSEADIFTPLGEEAVEPTCLRRLCVVRFGTLNERKTLQQSNPITKLAVPIVGPRIYLLLLLPMFMSVTALPGEEIIEVLPSENFTGKMH